MDLKDIVSMEVPLFALKHVASVNQVKVNGASTEAHVNALFGREQIQGLVTELLSEFRFAGNTSVNLMKPLSGIPSRFEDKVTFRQHLVDSHGGEALFSDTGIRVDISDDPALYRVVEQGSNLILAFTYLGAKRRYLENFEVAVRRPQMVEYVVVHFQPFLIEVRSSLTSAKRFLMALSRVLGVDPAGVDWFHSTRLSEAQLYQLRKKLGARMSGSKHKMDQGVYGSKEVTKALMVPDLAETTEYRNEFVGKPLVSSVWQFDYEYRVLGATFPVSFSISKEGGLRFYSQVGEEVINHMIIAIILVQNDTAAAASTASLISMIEADVAGATHSTQAAGAQQVAGQSG